MIRRPFLFSIGAFMVPGVLGVDMEEATEAKYEVDNTDNRPVGRLCYNDETEHFKVVFDETEGPEFSVVFDKYVIGFNKVTFRMGASVVCTMPKADLPKGLGATFTDAKINPKCWHRLGDRWDD